MFLIWSFDNEECKSYVCYYVVCTKEESLVVLQTSHSNFSVVNI